jgi:SAM-dependent methyltransferase
MLREFDDQRLVGIYDTVNAYEPGTQPEFYVGLALDVDAARVIDIGCGTGVVTCRMATPGREVTGVDPSAAMLEVARRRHGGDRVRWICGRVTDLGNKLGNNEAHLAVMTGHVAQFFLTDREWTKSLRAVRELLAPRGRFAFETRNPLCPERASWSTHSRKSVTDPLEGRIVAWSEWSAIVGGYARFRNHYLFAETREELVSEGRLRFRDEDELRSDLTDAGFSVEHIYGDWDRRPVEPMARELIVVAQRG